MLPTMSKDIARQLDRQHHKMLAEMAALPCNKYCADCAMVNPTWASANLGVFLCLNCSGVHRSLGVHISQVRSITMDSWFPEQIKVMQEMGNGKAQAIYLAKLPQDYDVPTSATHRSVMDVYIRAKYEGKQWAHFDRNAVPIDVPLQHSRGQPVTAESAAASAEDAAAARAAKRKEAKEKAKRLRARQKMTPEQREAEDAAEAAAAAAEAQRGPLMGAALGAVNKAEAAEDWPAAVAAYDEALKYANEEEAPELNEGKEKAAAAEAKAAEERAKAVEEKHLADLAALKTTAETAAETEDWAASVAAYDDALNLATGDEVEPLETAKADALEWKAAADEEKREAELKAFTAAAKDAAEQEDWPAAVAAYADALTLAKDDEVEPLETAKAKAAEEKRAADLASSTAAAEAAVAEEDWVGGLAAYDEALKLATDDESAALQEKRDDAAPKVEAQALAAEAEAVAAEVVAELVQLVVNPKIEQPEPFAGGGACSHSYFFVPPRPAAGTPACSVL